MQSGAWNEGDCGPKARNITVPSRCSDAPAGRREEDSRYRTTKRTVSTRAGCTGTWTPSPTTAMTRCSPGSTPSKV